MEYSKKLLEFRAKHSLNQTQLAEILGVTLNMIHRYERGLSQPSAVNKIRFENKMKEWEEEQK